MLVSLIRWILTIFMLMGLPLVGVMLTGHSISTYLEFPPLTRYVVHAPFSWWAFAIIGALNLLMLLGVTMLFRSRPGTIIMERSQPRRPFPSWGWLGVGVMLVGWLFAWTRFSWFAPLQPHTFCLPWAGYILAINAWCWKRSGTCLLTETPGRLLLLFPASAAFWWFFEFLNRIVQNWYYTGANDFSPLAYTLSASLAFSTVLPAVLSTLRLLLTVPLFSQRLAATIPLKLPHTPMAATLLLLISGSGLALLNRFPDFLYPLVWAAPLLVITAMQALGRQTTIFTPLQRGDWRGIVAAAVAALICGFFWEMWNFFSLARWEYAVPFVNRFHIFEMPVLGYGGYLPFGLECLLAGQLLIGRHTLGPNIKIA